MTTPLSEDEITALYTQRDGGFYFRRWGRAMAPVVFGVDDASLDALKATIEQAAGVTGQSLVETDPELGSNFMWIFCQDWDELTALPNFDKLIPDLPEKVEALKKNDAHSYRYFTFDDTGAINFCCVLVRVSGSFAAQPIQVIGMSETLMALSMFGPNAFTNRSPIAVIQENNLCVIKPEFACVIRASYDPTIPTASDDPAVVLRIKARADKMLAEIENAT